MRWRRGHGDLSAGSSADVSEPRQLETSALRISPKRSQASPLKRISCTCEIGAKSVGAGVDLDARQQAAEFEVLQVGGLLHDVLAGQVVAACLSTCTSVCATL